MIAAWLQRETMTVPIGSSTDHERALDPIQIAEDFVGLSICCTVPPGTTVHNLPIVMQICILKYGTWRL